MSPQKVVSATGWLTIPQVAAELDFRRDGAMTQELKVLRLIARGRLPASRLGPTGPWRISIDALSQFIRGGARDLNGPRAVGGWFDPLAFIRQRFIDSFTREAESQLPDQIGPDEPTRDRKLAVTPSMRAIADSPVPANPIRGRTWGEFLDFATAFFISELRLRAELAARGPRSKLAALYDPDRYGVLVEDALAAILRSGLGFTHQVKQLNRRTGQVDVVPAGFIVPWAELFTQARQIAAVAAAF